MATGADNTSTGLFSVIDTSGFSDDGTGNGNRNVNTNPDGSHRDNNNTNNNNSTALADSSAAPLATDAAAGSGSHAPTGGGSNVVGARNLVVSQLPRSIDTANLRAMFSEFGELITALVMMDVQSGRSRGFGFVWFQRAEDAQRALDTMDGRVLDADLPPLKVFPSDHPDGLSEAAAIHVLNFPVSVAQSCGREIFSQYGTLVKYEPAPPDNRAGSGSGTQTLQKCSIRVEYENILQARAAVNALHGVRQLQYGPVNVNLPLPLVTKYLIPGSIDFQRPSRPTSRTNSQRPTPANSATSASHGFIPSRHVMSASGAGMPYAQFVTPSGHHVTQQQHPPAYAPSMSPNASSTHNGSTGGRSGGGPSFNGGFAPAGSSGYAPVMSGGGGPLPGAYPMFGGGGLPQQQQQPSHYQPVYSGTGQNVFALPVQHQPHQQHQQHPHQSPFMFPGAQPVHNAFPAGGAFQYAPQQQQHHVLLPHGSTQHPQHHQHQQPLAPGGMVLVPVSGGTYPSPPSHSPPPPQHQHMAQPQHQAPLWLSGNSGTGGGFL